MNNKYKFINSEVIVEMKGKLLFEDVKYIENTLNRIRKTKNGFQYRIQIQAMLFDLDACISHRAIFYKRKDVDSNIRTLKEATEQLENKTREE